MDAMNARCSEVGAAWAVNDWVLVLARCGEPQQNSALESIRGRAFSDAFWRPMSVLDGDVWAASGEPNGYLVGVGMHLD